MKKQQTVAVVDDEPDMLAALKRMLKASGFAAEVFISAEEFLARGLVSEFACLILDINLGGISGIELRRRLASAGSSVPVIFMTGRDNDVIRREAVDTGCVAYLTKPFSGHALIEALASAVGS